MVENCERKKIIFSFSPALQICFALFSKFKTNQDTKTSIMKFFFDIMKILLTFKRNGFLKGTMVQMFSKVKYICDSLMYVLMWFQNYPNPTS